MKKPYQKPMLYAESFQLVEHIAGCGYNLKQNGDVSGFTDDWNTCTWKRSGDDFPMFTGSNQQCEIQVNYDAFYTNCYEYTGTSFGENLTGVIS